MSAEDITVEAPKATLFVQRSVKVRDYETLVVGMHFPVELPIRAVFDGDDEAYYKTVDQAIRDGYVTVKGHIFDQLALPYEDKEGVLLEKVANAFGAAEVQQAPQAAPAAAAGGSPHPEFGTCKGCGGNQFWDNRPRKASGQYSEKSPDAKCRNKECAKGVWLKKGN